MIKKCNKSSQHNKSFYALAILFIMQLQLGHAQSWQIEDLGRGEKPSIAISDAGVIMVSYVDETINSGYIELATIDGGGISTARYFEGSYIEGPAAIAIDPDGNPAVAVHDHLVENEVFFTFVNGEELREEIASDHHDGWDNTLTFDLNGQPHTASTDFRSGLEYATRIGNDWTKITLPTDPIFYGGAASIVTDDSNVPHIAYHNPTANTLEYIRQDGNTWILEVIEENGIFPNMAVDQTGHMYISYLKSIDVNVAEVKVARQVGPNWVLTTLDTLQAVGPVSMHSTSIQLDANDNPHISYADQKFVKYARLINGNWQIEIIAQDSGSPGTIGGLSDLILDRTGNPHIVYYTLPKSVKYATRSGGSQPIDADNDGFNADVDCDDQNPNVNPGVEEIPDNNIDENCDGVAEMTNVVNISGQFVDRNGEGIAQVMITSTHNGASTIFSDNDGRWSISGLTEDTQLLFQKDDNPLNGVSATDLVLARNYILGTVELSEEAITAADANNNGSVSVTDIVLTSNLLLERIGEYPGGLSWRFNLSSVRVNITDGDQEFLITGVKIGDTNGNANPKSQ